MSAPPPDTMSSSAPLPNSPEEAAMIAEMEAALARTEALAEAEGRARPAPTPPPAAPAPVAGRRRGRIAAVCLVAALVGTGTSAGLGVGRHPPAPPSAEHGEHAEHAEHGPWTEADAEHLDLLIRSGGYDEALKLCRAAPRDAFGKDDRPLVFREAACLEGLGRWKDARAAYARVADASADERTWVPAALGQARCAAADGETAVARGLLNRAVLRSGHPACREQYALDECLHLRGRLDLLELGPRPDPDPLDAEAIAWPAAAAGLEYTAIWLPPGGESPEPEHAPARPAGPAAVAARRFFWAPEPTEVTARVPAAPAAETIAAIAAAAGLEARIAPEAAARLAAAGRLPVDVDRAPLPEVLTALAELAGVGWRTDGKVLVVEPAGPPAPAAPAAPAARAAHSLRYALGYAPDHPHARAARVALVNLAHDAGRLRAAAGGYRRILETDPHGSMTVLAAYNLGLLELRDGSLAVARARFLDVIDYGPGSRWAALGWWWVGRTQLDAGDTQAARKTLRAVRAGKSKTIGSAVALAACLCDLLDGKDDAARAVLRRQRFFDHEAYTGTAEWIGALLRYRAGPTDGRAGEVQADLRAAGNGRPFGRAGVFLAGQAYAETGRPDRMVALYDEAAATARGPLAVRMTFDAAEHLYQLDSRGPARQRFLAVAAADPTGLGPRAQLRVAELAARDGRGEECVGRCRGVVGAPGIDQAELLPVMGRGFELVGRYRLAAECYAGRLPAE